MRKEFHKMKDYLFIPSYVIGFAMRIKKAVA